MSFTVLGTGMAVPSRVVTNSELAGIVDTSDEWITTRTGIKKRHVITSETATDLCKEAALKALCDAGVSASELDLIICATIRGDYITPSQACVIQKEIGAACPSFDLNGACSGFVYALDVADSYFKAGKIKKALIVAVDCLSSVTDYTDRSTCVLFGDGGGAVVLGEGDDLLSINLTAKGNTDFLYAPSSRASSPFNNAEAHDPLVRMNGQEVYKFAVFSLVRGIKKAAKDAGIDTEQIDYVLPHQANIRIIETAAAKLGIPYSKYLTNIAEYGNTSAGSIPILLDESAKAGKFKKGDLIALCAFGAGLTSGSAVIRWNK